MTEVGRIRTGVLVVGSGLAGIRAASVLADAGVDSVLLSSGPFRSGASFCPWTWGLGMIAPRDDADRDDLLAEIGKVGLGLNEPALGRILVERVESEIRGLEDLGVQFKPCIEPGGVVPCFGTNRRKWFGFDFPSARKAFAPLESAESLRILDRTAVLAMFDGGAGSKAALCAGRDGGLMVVEARAVVLASGGFTSAFSRSFSAEVSGEPLHAQAAALGCAMRNLEFVQFIPAHSAPAEKTIFNERAFGRVRLEKADGTALLAGGDARDLLALRSTHGPFTTRLASVRVDEAMFAHFLRTGRPVTAVYPDDIDREPDTLIRNYFQWFRQRFGDGFPRRLGIMHYAHACNGGISIDADGRSSVEGVYACGETAGGVHGADRIGGLATGTALVFGAAAGKAAGGYCREVQAAAGAGTAGDAAEDFARAEIGRTRGPGAPGSADTAPDAGNAKGASLSHGPTSPAGVGPSAADDILRRFRESMYADASIVRTPASLEHLRAATASLKDETADAGMDLAARLRLQAYFGLADLFVDAMRSRPHPAGCHNFVAGG